MPKCGDGNVEYKRYKIIIDNLPTLAMYALGTIIIFYLNMIFAVTYVLYCVLATVWFWRFICTYCPHYDELTCPCGFSKISAKLFKKRDTKKFLTMFRRHLVIIFPAWFLPIIAAVFILMDNITIEFVSLLIAFLIVGFVIIPIVSRRYGCKDCDLRENCPWMRGCRK